MGGDDIMSHWVRRDHIYRFRKGAEQFVRLLRKSGVKARIVKICHGRYRIDEWEKY